MFNVCRYLKTAKAIAG